MNWNHRVVKRTYVTETIYGIHEVYYEDGKPTMVTAEPVAIQCTGDDGEPIEVLREALERATRALEHPILNYEDFD